MEPGLGEQLLTASLDGRPADTARKIEDVARGTLAGSVWSMPSARAPNAETRVAILGDGVYVYPLRLDADAGFAEAQAGFSELLASVRSLRERPGPGALVDRDGDLSAAATALLSYWT